MDRDTIEKAARLMNGSVKVKTDQRSNRQTTYRVEIYGEKARRVMEAVLPIMSERRTRKINACFETVRNWNEHKKNKTSVKGLGLKSKYGTIEDFDGWLA